MQGSFSYRTCNDPAHNPPQEIDLDDGMFLPISFLTGNGTIHPSIVSDGFFLAVERILEPLCKEAGWTLDKRKPSCVRVQISDVAHIDIALYAIPDADFTTLVEKSLHAEDMMTRDATRQNIRDSVRFLDEVYRNIPRDHIILAHRDKGWKRSDPRKLDDWFKEAVDTHGEQLRRVSRYLKGWRDFQWEMSRLSSIALMAGVVSAYEKFGKAISEQRDDKALLVVAEELPATLSKEISNPVVQGERLDEGWSADERASYVAAANDLLKRLQDAILGTDDANISVSGLTRVFGERIPDDPSLVSLDNGNLETKAIGAPAIISLDDSERARRAELAAREVEARGVQSKPWAVD
jgi:hypothetical protein